MKPFAVLVALTVFSSATGAQADAPAASAATLRVAAVQMRSTADLRANVAQIKKYLAECAGRKVEIAIFPECAVSSYTTAPIEGASAADFAAAEAEIVAACREYRIAAIVGTPAREDGRLFNRALVITPQGEVIARYDKTHLVGQDEEWKCTPGMGLPPVFTAGATRASVIICHDSRYPELCRLPVLAGARVIFYISSEAVLSKENKMGPYRAQVQARAVENGVFIVHANPPADGLNAGSHGQSRIVAPDGNVLQEASQMQAEVLVADLNLADATAKNGLRSQEEGPLAEWWRAAVAKIPQLK